MNLEKIKTLLATETLKQSIVTFSGTLINGVLGVLFFVFAAKYLGPSSYGLLSVSIATLTLIADVSDLGVDTGLVRFVGKYADSKPKRAKQYLKLGLEIKLVVGFLIVIIGFLTASFWSDTVFQKPELFVPMRLAFVGVLGALLFSFVTHTLQAFQKFVSWSVVLVATNLIRLFLLFGVFYFGLVNISSTLIIYITMPMLGFVAGMFILPYFLAVKHSKKVRQDFFHYNKWVAAMTAIAAASSRLDIFLTARLLPIDQVGVYSIAQQLTQVVPQIVAAFGTVIAPKMASMDTKDKLIAYLKKTQLLVSGVVLLGFLGIPVAFLFFPLIGPGYVASIPVFIVLLIAMLIFLFSVPVHNAVFYYYAYPRLFFWLAIGHFAVISTSGWYLIGQYGAIGAAFSVMLGSIFNFTIPALWVFKKLKDK